MKQHIVIPPEAVGERADKFVAEALPAYSRSFWQKQFALGRITVAGSPLKASAALDIGELDIELPEVVAMTIDLPILYEDDEVVVINKPTGILTHAKGAIVEEATVADFMRPRTTDDPTSNRAGIVHRLDRDTSGVLIAAKTPEAKRWLQKQFAERKVKKSYIALVEGHVEPPKAVLRLPIERNPKAPQKFRVGASGKPSETAYEVLEYLPRHTLVELRPHTGRTHQLRVHMTHQGYPIVGDRIYGKSKPDHRLFLHAQTLEITLPNRERKVFTAPLPDDLTTYLETRR
ncbi:MAG TPA: RluA family pseudouridine synthase [Candidatus Saccharimonadales bacterium]|nr:RluA family pseudouridine synthase [Candidatus Saccharimonadales bacterium]